MKLFVDVIFQIKLIYLAIDFFLWGGGGGVGGASYMYAKGLINEVKQWFVFIWTFCTDFIIVYSVQ